MRLLILLASAIAAGLLITMWASGQPADSTKWRAAEVYPATRDYRGDDFKLPNLSGDTISLYEHRGKMVFMNIWASWCPPCRDEVPSLIRLQEEFGELGVQVIGVAIDEEQHYERVTDFASEYGVNYPVLLDDGRVQERYGPLSVIPTTYILDENGYIRFYVPGYMEYKQMETIVRELLKAG